MYSKESYNYESGRKESDFVEVPVAKESRSILECLLSAGKGQSQSQECLLSAVMGQSQGAALL